MSDSSKHLFFLPQVKELIEDFSFCFDIKITFFSPDMYEYLVGYHTQTSDYCTMLQKRLDYRHRCLEQDNMMCSKCKRLNSMVSYRCYAGCNEAILPIRIDDEVVAYGFIGQFRTTDKLPQEVVKEWVKQGNDVEELERAFLDRPFFSQEKLERMLNIFSRNIEYIVKTEGMKLRRPALIEQVILYIGSHMGDKVTIGEVAEAINKSESTISHAIKKEFGISFKEFLIEQKIDYFEKQVLSNPGLTIKEAIESIGYEDSLYFSRLYHKKRGYAPSLFLKRVRSSKNTTL